MIMPELNVISLLSDQRLLDAIDAHLRQDSRGVQFAGLFGSDGSRITGNIAKLPPDLISGTPAHRVQIMAIRGASLENQIVQGVARQLRDGEVLVIGRLVDETVGVARVIGQALGLGLVFALGLCLVAGTLASLRAAKRVEEVNSRVPRILAGGLRERLAQRAHREPFSKSGV